MDPSRTSAFRSPVQRLLPGLLLAALTGGAFAAPPPPPPPPPPPAPGAPPQRGQYLAPRYPAESADARESGTVVLILDVTADGSVTRVELETSSGFPKLDAAATEAAARWHFTPPQVAGKPVGGRVRVPVNFALD